jgi:nucleolar protein 56
VWVQVEERLRFYDDGVAPRKNATVMAQAMDKVNEAGVADALREPDAEVAEPDAEMAEPDAEMAEPEPVVEKPKKKKKKKRASVWLSLSLSVASSHMLLSAM